MRHTIIHAGQMNRICAPQLEDSLNESSYALVCGAGTRSGWRRSRQRGLNRSHHRRFTRRNYSRHVPGNRRHESESHGGRRLALLRRCHDLRQHRGGRPRHRRAGATGTCNVTITVTQGSPAKTLFKTSGSIGTVAKNVFEVVSVGPVSFTGGVAGATTINVATTIGTATIKGAAKIVLH